MRITNKMLSNNFLSDMQLNLQNLSKIQQQMSSTKNFSKPSDDPFNVVRSMQLQTDINANKQYKANITSALNFMNTTDTAFGQIGSMLGNVRDNLVKAGDAAYGSDERAKIADEVNQRVAQLAQQLNTSFQGDYIFAGTRGLSKPVMTVTDDKGNISIKYADKNGDELTDLDGEEMDSLNSKRKMEVAQGVVVEYNANVSEVLQYGSDEKDNTMELLNRIVHHLNGQIEDGSGGWTDSSDEATAKLIGEDLSDIDLAAKQAIKVRSEIGSKSNRMDDLSDQNDDSNINMTDILSKTEDIDITQKTIEYYTMMTVYQACLQTSAKVIQPTLMDYIR